MPERKLIAVTGATGAQGGGLARAILNDPDGGFAVRALTRDPSREKAKALARRRRRGRAGGHRRSWQPRACVRRRLRRVLRHLLLGPLLGRARRRARPSRWRAAAKAAGVEHVDLVDARGHARLHAARRRPDADAAGQVQGAALRRQGGSRTAFFTDAGVPTTFLSTCVLLGELHLLRPRAAARRGRGARAHDSDGRQAAARDRLRGHRQGRLRDLQRGPS